MADVVDQRRVAGPRNLVLAPVDAGIAELITYGQYHTLDLSALSHERIANNQPLVERAVI